MVHEGAIVISGAVERTGARLIVLIVRADAGALALASGSVDAVITSPPYNVGMAYNGVDDTLAWPQYQTLADRTCAEIARVLRPGGRAWINLPVMVPAGTGDGDRVHVPAMWTNALARAGVRLRDQLVWEQEAQDAATAWGSYLSPNAPNIRGRYEVILLAFKETWARGRVEHNDLPAEEWAELTRNVWRMPTAARTWHPAPFPRELARRAILLSTWRGDVVLDPFMGSGTTLRTASELGRLAVGADLSAAYCRQVAAVGYQAALL